ncbi:MAG: UvrD-helicase domain-containing protein [Bacteroidetes bacterium]|nr:UvrD-helicase domain-containing protein [Bacteroidota bacterium]
MSFNVLKASAGSGKTFRLVNEYLKILLIDPSKFRNILAITFTNKAANEMKERILKVLTELSEDKIDENSKSFKNVLPELIKMTSLSQKEICSRAKTILKLILHNYSDFAVYTIDSFFHKIIRTFAHDLHLSQSFEIELDSKKVIDDAINILIDKVGQDLAITNILVEFIESRTDDEKSWVIERDLAEIAKVLFDENGEFNVSKLKPLNTEDYSKMALTIRKAIHKYETELSNIGKEAWELIQSKGLSHEDFFSGKSGISKMFYNAAFKIKFDLSSNPKKTIEENKWTSGKCPETNKAAIENIKNILTEKYNQIAAIIKAESKKYAFYKILINSLYPIAVLVEIEKIVLDLKIQNNIVLISEFNRRIGNIVMEEPIPYIYERIGEKYQHFLIDEFQDTSVLQWQNILPLVENSLASNNFNLIVGDGKQAIYRWRGGEVRQFSELPKVFNPTNNPLILEREKAFINHYHPDNLPTNFRSKKEIVDFNNDFFNATSKLLSSENQKIYEGIQQECNPENIGGFIKMEFIASEKGDNGFEAKSFEKIKETINELLLDGFNLKDIAILFRDNKNANKTANYLTQQNINVVSSESLLLNSSSDVRFLVSFLNFLNHPNEILYQSEILNFLFKKGLIKNADFNETLLSIKKNSDKNFFLEFLKNQGFQFNIDELKTKSVFQLCEEIYRIFLSKTDVNIYVQFFLDAGFKFGNNQSNNILEFLDWWSLNKTKAAISMPQELDAVKIMSIHKAKGLEFPVVIYPFSREAIKPDRSKLWLEVSDPDLPDLNTALLNAGKTLNETFYQKEYEEELEQLKLDFFNVNYVAFTRPTDRLYIFTASPPKTDTGNLSLPKLLQYYLKQNKLWLDNQLIYTFGKNIPYLGKPEKNEYGTVQLQNFISNEWKNKVKISTKAPEFWDIENPQGRQDWGNLIHLILSKIENKNSFEKTIKELMDEGAISENEREKITKKINELLTNPEISQYFEENTFNKTEVEIIGTDGFSYRPDRIFIAENSTTVIDYKTGQKRAKHKEQIEKYAELLAEMGYKNIKKRLIYLDPIEILDI